MKYLKLWATALFVFVSFQTLGSQWHPNNNLKIECRFTSPLNRVILPVFNCSGDIIKEGRRRPLFEEMPPICRGSVECKNSENVIMLLPSVLCTVPRAMGYSRYEGDWNGACSSVNPIDCLFGHQGIYRNRWLQEMLPEKLLPPRKSIREFGRGDY